MSDHQSPSGSEPTSSHGGSPYVIEHYGFAASYGETGAALPGTPTTTAGPRSVQPVGRPARMRRRRILAAGALGLVLAGGVGGVATATAATGHGAHDPGVRGGVFPLDGAFHGDGRPANFDGHGGRR